MTSATERDYNEQQQALIDAPISSRAIGVAGAGTGKTTTILGRAKRIMDECSTGYLLLITFTRAAANDLKKRLEASNSDLPFLEDGTPNKTPNITSRMMVGTFHSVIASFIRRHATEVGLDPNFSIIDENSTGIMFRNLVESSTSYMEELKKWVLAPNEDKLAKKHFNLLTSTVSALVNMASPEELETGKFAKPTLYYLTKTHKSITEQNVAFVADFCYRMFKESIVDGKRTNTITYDQVLFIGYLMAKADMLKTEREGFVHTIVDEYQDTNLLQDAFIRYIAGEKLTIVGDIDQSIYEFRGGRSNLILKYVEEGATVYNLSYNYRSYQGLLDLANKVIHYNETGQNIRKDLTAIRGNSPDCKISLAVAEKDYNESEDIVENIKNLHDNFDVPYHNMAILIRSRMTLPSISQALTRANIPVNDTTKYADFMKSDVLVDTLNYLKVFTNPKDIYAFLGIIDRPKQGIGPAAIAKLNDFAVKHNMGLVEYLLSSEISELTPALKKKVEKFVKAYESIIKGNNATNISLETVVSFLHDAFGYTEWLMTLKNKDRYKRDLITLKGVLNDFEEQYRKENQNPTLYDLANAFVFDMASIAVRDEGRDGVCLTTIHNAKGLEWDHVFLIGLEQENFPGTQMVDKDDMESERRLCYVAITRAKDTLHLYATKKRITSEDELTPSQFIGEMGIMPSKLLQ